MIEKQQVVKTNYSMEFSANDIRNPKAYRGTSKVLGYERMD